MWYILHCPQKNEDMILQSCRQKIDRSVLKDAFSFTCEKMRRYQGSWHLEKQKLFPEYVFLESDDALALSKALEPYRDIVQVLEAGELLWPVEKSEENFLKELCGESRHLSMSRGVIHSGKTHVTEGPLKGKEQMIAKIDRHKRLAFLRLPDAKKDSYVKVGLEIVEKIV